MANEHPERSSDAIFGTSIDTIEHLERSPDAIVGTSVATISPTKLVVPAEDASALSDLGVDVVDHNDVARNFEHEANRAMIVNEDKKDRDRIELAQAKIQKLKARKERCQKKLGAPQLTDVAKTTIDEDLNRLDKAIGTFTAEIKNFRGRIERRHKEQQAVDELPTDGNQKLPKESQRDFLLRTGKITPFSNIQGSRGATEEASEADDDAVAEELADAVGREPLSHQHLATPGLATAVDSISSTPSSSSSKKRKAPSDRDSHSAASRKKQAADLYDGYTDEGDSDDSDIVPIRRQKKRRPNLDGETSAVVSGVKERYERLAAVSPSKKRKAPGDRDSHSAASRKKQAADLYDGYTDEGDSDDSDIVPIRRQKKRRPNLDGETSAVVSGVKERYERLAAVSPSKKRKAPGDRDSHSAAPHKKQVAEPFDGYTDEGDSDDSDIVPISQLKKRKPNPAGETSPVVSGVKDSDDPVVSGVKDSDDRVLQKPLAAVAPSKKRKAQSDRDDPSAATRTNQFREPEEDHTKDSDSNYAELTEEPQKKRRKSDSPDVKANVKAEVVGCVDDGDEGAYRKRLAAWVKTRSSMRKGAAGQDKEEWYKPSPVSPGHRLPSGLMIPGDIYPKLFDYQKVGVQWLDELYSQKVGGILGDDMGLGKTIQTITFLAALHHSKKLTKPILVIAGGSLLQNWVHEFHKWWAPMRVSILHSSGSGMRGQGRGRASDREPAGNGVHNASKTAAMRIVDRVQRQGHVIMTTYESLKAHSDLLLPIEWGYVVLDEGHKIKNPDAEMSRICTHLRSRHRLILSGTPVQNRLKELWALFDFVYQGRLGTYPEFSTNFEVPIGLAHRKNATYLEIMAAQKCAEVLHDTISPYHLHRLKKDVAASLPASAEKVMFCRTTPYQREVYKDYLTSHCKDLASMTIEDRLASLHILSKISNHPDLWIPNQGEYIKKGLIRPQDLYRRLPAGDERDRVWRTLGDSWAQEHKSGKMRVLKRLLLNFKQGGHKTLVFSQGTQMLDIVQSMVEREEGMNFLRMDGTTAIKGRQQLVDKFNDDPELDVFLLTTGVGGIGLNLTGADRVIIVDPDWNPAKDKQATERARRLGQKREVEIYRLIMKGTVEERVYMTQHKKTWLTDKVLKDPTIQDTSAFCNMPDAFIFDDNDAEGEDTSRAGKRPQASRVRSTSKSTDAGRETGKVTGEEIENLLEIAGVASMEDMHRPEAVETVDLLRTIFDPSTTRGQKDVGNGGWSITSDPAAVIREAERVAACSRTALAMAAERARRTPAGTPTWTGKYGVNPNSNTGRGQGLGSGAYQAGTLARGRMPAGSSARPSANGDPRARTPEPQAFLTVADLERVIVSIVRNHQGPLLERQLKSKLRRYTEVSKRQAKMCKTAWDNVLVKDVKNSTHFKPVWILAETNRETTGKSS